MSFLEPLFLLGLLGAGVPVLIHLINRRKAIQQPFPALSLLRDSDKKEARSIKVRQWLLMALRILAVALLALALAKPYVYSETGVGSGDRLPKSVVFVVDDTLSMQRGDWWEEARERLSEQLDGLKPWDEAALITTTTTDEPVGRLESDRGRLWDAFDKLSPSQRTAELPAAIQAASDILSTSDLPNQRIVVISDFTLGGFPESKAKNVETAIPYPVREVSVREEGEAVPNLAVVDVTYRQQGPAREGRWEIGAKIHNFGNEDRTGVQVQLRIDEETVASGVVDVPAGESVTHAIQHRVRGTGVRRGSVVLDGADALEVDNRRYFTFRMKENVKVLLVNGAPSSVPYRDELFFAVRALNPGKGSDSNLVPNTVTPDALGDTELSNFDVVMLANVARLEPAVTRKLEGFVEDGGGLFLAMGGQVETEIYNQNMGGLLPKPLRRVKRLAERGDPDAPVKITRIGSSRRQHPVFRVFNLPGGTSLQSVRVYKYMLLEPSPPEQSTVLLSYKDGAPALLERKVGQGRVFMLTTTVDRAWTDLPVRTAFLPLMRRSMLYLARRATSKGAERYIVGERVQVDVTGLIDERAIIRGPGDTRFVLEPEEGLVSFVPERAGAYSVWAGSEDAGTDEENGTGNRLDGLAFSVNVNVEESNLSPLGPDALDPWLKPGEGAQNGEGGAQASTAPVPKKRFNIWPVLLFCVTLALLLETLIGTRRSVLKRLWRRMTMQKDPEIEV